MQVVLFERVTFLVIAQCSRKQHHDVHRFEKISNIIKQFKLSCGRSQSQPLSMHISNSTFSAFVGSFTSNTAIMVVSTDPDVRVASTEMNVKLARPGEQAPRVGCACRCNTRAQCSRSSSRRMRVRARRQLRRGYRAGGLQRFAIKLVISPCLAPSCMAVLYSLGSAAAAPAQRPLVPPTPPRQAGGVQQGRRVSAPSSLQRRASCKCVWEEKAREMSTREGGCACPSSAGMLDCKAVNGGSRM